MAITITIGTISVDPRTLDKRNNFESSDTSDISVNIKDNCSIMQPVFILTASAVDIVGYNYIYVASWGRYYFIKNIITMPGTRIEIICKEDVLTSNADAIKNIVGTVGRQQSTAMRDKWLQDPKMLQSSKIYTYNLHFSENPFTYGDGALQDQVHYILSVVGGNGT